MDTRSWKERRKRELHAWEPYLEELTNSYIKWKCGSHDVELESKEYPYTLTVLDIFSLQTKVTVYRPATSNCPALDLALHGYLPKTPMKPEMAVGLRTLELFHRVRLRKASLSVEAFTRVICDYYEVCPSH